MRLFGNKKAKPIIGRAPEELSITERFENAGKWLALEIYTPTTLSEEAGQVQIELKMRRIRALADSVPDCIAQLQQAGLDPKRYEFTQITPLFRW